MLCRNAFRSRPSWYSLCPDTLVHCGFQRPDVWIPTMSFGVPEHVSARILIVDDHESSATMLERLLRSVGYREIVRSEEHTSELQSQSNLVCRLLLEKKNK